MVSSDEHTDERTHEPTTRHAPERGASLVEYVLLVGLIALVCVASVSLLGDATVTPYSSVTTELDR
ncbi:MAG: Flp family type IVb pilin [Acidimicrobiales bacterium]